MTLTMLCLQLRVLVSMLVMAARPVRLTVAQEGPEPQKRAAAEVGPIERALVAQEALVPLRAAAVAVAVALTPTTTVATAAAEAEPKSRYGSTDEPI